MELGVDDATDVVRMFKTIIRYLFLESYYGKHQDGFALYNKMYGTYAEKRKARFIRLIESWEKNGYDEKSRIPCNRDLRLQDGLHRIALALYHRLDKINCTIDSRVAKHRAIDWIVDGRFTEDEFKMIFEKYNELVS